MTATAIGAPGLEVRAEPGKVALVGEADASNMEELASALSSAEAIGGELLVDLTGLSFIDVGGTRQLIGLARKLAPDDVRVIGPPPQLRTIVEAVGWEDELHIGTGEMAR
jgi:anti-anti-sigma regulatory factor